MGEEKRKGDRGAKREMIDILSNCNILREGPLHFVDQPLFAVQYGFKYFHRQLEMNTLPSLLDAMFSWVWFLMNNSNVFIHTSGTLISVCVD